MRNNPPAPTLEQLRRGHPWTWVVCERCLRRWPVAFAPLIIRWGPQASNDLLRSSARCTKGGTKGARPAASVLDEYGRRLGAVSDPVRRGPLPWAWSPRPTAEHPYQPPAKLSECLAVVAVLAQM